MSRYANELERRLSRGASLQQTAEWFIRCKANEPKIQKADFTPLERAFWNEIVRGHMRWTKLHLAFWGYNTAQRYLRLKKLYRTG